MMRLLPRRLFLRLLVVGLLGTTGTAMLLAAWSVASQQQAATLAAEREAISLASSIASASAGQLIRRGYADIEEGVVRLMDLPLLMDVQVINAEDRVVTHVRREWVGAPPQLVFTTAALQDDRMLPIRRTEDRIIVWVPMNPSLVRGWVRVEFSLDQVHASAHHWWKSFALVGISAAAAGAALLFLLLRGPIRRLRRAARFAEALPLGNQPPLPADADILEVDTLAMALNQASDRLRAQETALSASQRRQELRNRLNEKIAQGDALASLLRLIVESVEAENPEMLCSILIFNPTNRTLTLGAAPRLPAFYNDAIEGLEIGEGVGSCGTAAFRGELVVVEDTGTHPYWAPFRDLTKRAGLASCWSMPIRSSHGDMLGTFAVYHRSPAAPEPAELDLINQVSHLASLVIERSRAEEELRLAASVYHASGEAIVVTDEANRIIAVNPAFTKLTGYASVEVLGSDPKMLASGQMTGIFYRNMWAALESADQWQGEIINRRKNGEAFTEWLTINVIRDAQGNVYRRIGIFSDITARKKAEEIIWQQANYDQLTNLPNRRLFRDRLDMDLRRANHQSTSLAVLCIDLDRFQEVNDAVGHDAGDRMLMEVARRIGSCLRESDTLARMGSDEFHAILTHVTDPGEAERIAQSILNTLATPFQLEGEDVYISASVGVTLFPNDADDAESLIQNAEQAMQAAKAIGGASFSWFTLELQMAAQVRRELVRDLRSALAENQLQVYYQPIIDLHTGRIVKAEALLRWLHPERGHIGPAIFIPLAEEVGLIQEIGDWVFRTAANQSKDWLDKGLPPLQVSVNKSPRQFSSPGYVEDWLHYLDEIKLPPERIVIEITEGLLLDERPEVVERLLAYRAAGVEIAIDDFGTGYSTLSYLQRFDIDYLKIDRSFIKGLADDEQARALTDAIIVMAHKLGLKVIAEGVETAAQRDWLVGAGCDYVQGFLYARAVPAGEFETLLRQH